MRFAWPIAPPMSSKRFASCRGSKRRWPIRSFRSARRGGPGGWDTRSSLRKKRSGRFAGAGPDAPAAIVFGRESSGLTNPELALCSIQSTIPVATENHSLNLAQAVLVYCYVLYQASLTPATREHDWNLATHVELEHFYGTWGEPCRTCGLKPATTMESYLARFRRVLSRIPFESRDVNLLHKLLSKIDEATREQVAGKDS